MSRKQLMRLSIIAVICACGGSGGEGTPPIVAQSLTIVSGDQQKSVRGGDISDPLRVRVIGSDGKPLSNATVTWVVTKGQATLDPATSLTDTRGETETRVPLLSAIGPVNISATVGGVSPVVFSASALDPCSFPRHEQPSTDISGQLIALDCDFFAGRLADFYDFQLAQAGAILAHVQSNAFDAALWFYTGGFPYALAFALDSTDVAHDASLKMIVAPGLWVFGVSSTTRAVTGQYTFRVAPTPESAESCEKVWLTGGVTTAQQLNATDCLAGDGSRYDGFFVALHEGATMTFSESSTAFAPALSILDTTGKVVASASAPVGGTASFTLTSPMSSFYLVRAASSDAVAAGTYALTTSPLLLASRRKRQYTARQ